MTATNTLSASILRRRYVAGVNQAQFTKFNVIKEIDKKEVRNLIDFGKAVKAAMKECNFTVGTYEPADPGDPVGWGVNFHFVGCKRD